MAKKKPQFERVHFITLEETNVVGFYFFIGLRNFNPYIDIEFLSFCGVEISKKQFKDIHGSQYVTSKLTPMKKGGKKRDRTGQYVVPLEHIFELFPIVKERFTNVKDELKIRSSIRKLNSTENALARFVEPFFTTKILPKLMSYTNSEKDRPCFSELMSYTNSERDKICSYDVFARNRLCFFAFSINIYKTKFIYIGFTWNLKETLTRYFCVKKTPSNEFLLNDFNDIFFIGMHENINQFEESYHKNRDVNRFAEFIDEKTIDMAHESWTYDYENETRELILKASKTSFLKILTEIKREQAHFFENGFIFLNKKELSNVIFQADFEINTRHVSEECKTKK